MNCIIKNHLTRIFLISFFFSLLLVRYKLDYEKAKIIDPILKNIKEFEKSTSKSFFSTFFIESEISMSKKFIKFNEKNELMDKISLINMKKSENPEISVIMTVYNQEECFYKGLRSIQNQSFKNIEIIIVDDCSFDNSVDKIVQYQKEDNRIVLLKHLTNYGKIKSRCDAIKLSKGKYITIIDGDDALASKNILFNCLNIAKIGNLDIVEFKLVSSYKYLFKGNAINEGKIKNINSKIIYQPELKYIFIKLNQLWSIKNRNICQKFIKNEVFQKVVQYIGPKYTEDFILEFEDTIMAISLFIISRSYYLLENIGYYRGKCECVKCLLINQKTIANKIKNKHQLDSMKYINFLSEKLNNNRFNSQVIYYELLSVAHYHHNFEENIDIDFKYILNILDNIIKKFKFYSKQQTDRIINLKNRLLEKEKMIKIL